MYVHTYFPDRYFPQRYFPQTAGAAPEPPPAEVSVSLGARGGGGRRYGDDEEMARKVERVYRRIIEGIEDEDEAREIREEVAPYAVLQIKGVEIIAPDAIDWVALARNRLLVDLLQMMLMRIRQEQDDRDVEVILSAMLA